MSVIDNMNMNTQKKRKKRVAHLIKNDWIILFAICRNLRILDLEALILIYTFI